MRISDWSSDVCSSDLDHVAEGTRVLGLVGTSCRNVWYGPRFEHLPGFALERRRAFSNDQWSMAGAQLLTVRYHAARGFAHDPSEIVTTAQCPREYLRPVSEALATFPRAAFDYVWLINPQIGSASCRERVCPYV